MVYFLVRSKVEDFARWKPVFDEMSATRKARGSKGGYMFQNADDPHEVVVLLEFEDTKSARQFAQSSDLKEAMNRAGVSDKPNIYLLNEVDRPSV
jgi:heme-degrading monooxygenase HmoA